jgi:hypothetical protein
MNSYSVLLSSSEKKKTVSDKGIILHSVAIDSNYLLVNKHPSIQQNKVGQVR